MSLMLARSYIQKKYHNTWWDLEQLWTQIVDANIFEYLHPDKIGVWLFNLVLPQLACDFFSTLFLLKAV